MILARAAASSAARAVLAALVPASAVLFGGCGDDAGAAQMSRVEMTEMRFSPARLSARANERFVVVAANRGDAVHTFSLNELGLEVKVPAGEERRLTIKAPAARYEYVCRILDHEGLGMVGQLVLN